MCAKWETRGLQPNPGIIYEQMHKYNTKHIKSAAAVCSTHTLETTSAVYRREHRKVSLPTTLIKMTPKQHFLSARADMEHWKPTFAAGRNNNENNKV